ncbi:hypothetical protein [uncultured Thiodictyon sp.]|jgi:hypothetical protein|uniref:hypothetical protein n=1 Tax=uncultured Thiodictyon sp. TaxID=1846217 RepID=UPI0025D82C5C|nr:hypothetical protein [uncultured Thiodictyon sp.]
MHFGVRENPGHYDNLDNDNDNDNPAETLRLRDGEWGYPEPQPHGGLVVACSVFAFSSRSGSSQW